MLFYYMIQFNSTTYRELIINLSVFWKFFLLQFVKMWAYLSTKYINLMLSPTWCFSRCTYSQNCTKLPEISFQQESELSPQGSGGTVSGICIKWTAKKISVYFLKMWSCYFSNPSACLFEAPHNFPV